MVINLWHGRFNKSFSTNWCLSAGCSNVGKISHLSWRWLVITKLSYWKRQWLWLDHQCTRSDCVCLLFYPRPVPVYLPISKIINLMVGNRRYNCRGSAGGDAYIPTTLQKPSVQRPILCDGGDIVCEGCCPGRTLRIWRRFVKEEWKRPWQHYRTNRCFTQFLNKKVPVHQRMPFDILSQARYESSHKIKETTLDGDTRWMIRPAFAISYFAILSVPNVIRSDHCSDFLTIFGR